MDKTAHEERDFQRPKIFQNPDVALGAAALAEAAPEDFAFWPQMQR